MSKDFSVDSYRAILKQAKNKFNFISYPEIDLNQKFVLWRHDCDVSLNRAYRLAQVEAEVGIKATYFLLPHSGYYNLMEKSQADLVHKIMDLGHHIGLHFDADFYDITSEDQLNELVMKEANWIEDWFGVRPPVFSFHNPTEYLLTCENETYGGLLNTYSSTFKNKITYCSDSNGYWRFRNLKEVVTDPEISCLQILTHPEWWQENLMAPRERIFRAIYGRAFFAQREYDKGIEAFGRKNVAGFTSCFQFMKKYSLQIYEMLDYLYQTGNVSSLVSELCRLQRLQTKRLIVTYLTKNFDTDLAEIEHYFSMHEQSNHFLKELEYLCKVSFEKLTEESISAYETILARCRKICEQFIATEIDHVLEDMTIICQTMEKLSFWAENDKKIGTSGIEELDVPGEKFHSGGDEPCQEWVQLLQNHSQAGQIFQ